MRIARLTIFVAATATLGAVPVYAQGRGHSGPTVAHGNPHTTASASPKNTSTTSSAGTTTTTGGTTTSSNTSPTGSTATTPTLNPIAAKISSHPQLASKCTSLLPNGMTLNQASSGFRNQGQFIAALHVSKNLHIPFAQLKSTMLGTPTPGNPSTAGTSGTTTTSPLSLGQAIHKLRPTVDADDAAEHATTQASTDLRSTTASTSSTTAATSTHK